MKVALRERLPLSDKMKNGIYTIYSVVDHSRFQPLIKPEKSKIFTVIVVAAFNEFKNQYQFLENCRELLKDLPIKIEFVGDMNNEYGLKCKELVDNSPLKDKITFLGFTEEIEAVYKKADCS